MTTDNKTIILNRIFYSILFLIIAVSVVLTFVKIVVLKDYQIITEVSCNSSVEKCFVLRCDPAQDTNCPKNPTDRISYYKKISKKASTIAVCESTTEKIGCQNELSCTSRELSCSYINCDPTKILKDEECSN